MVTPEVWECPRCGYSLRGLVVDGNARCPECDRRTDGREQEALRRSAAMPRSLGTIAKVGVAVTLMVMGWTAVSALQQASRGASVGVHGVLAGVGVPCLLGGLWVWRSLERVYARHEVLGWAAAHATLAYALAAIALLRWT